MPLSFVRASSRTRATSIANALAIAFTWGLSSCGGESLPPSAPTEPASLSASSGADAGTSAGSRTRSRTDHWSSLTWEEKHDAMTFVVLPNMARTFQRYHGSPDAVLTCRSCHGTDAERVAYAMPHGLPPLDPAHLPAEDLHVVRFMRQEVVPTMSDLIDKDVTCFSCHPRGSSP